MPTATTTWIGRRAGAAARVAAVGGTRPREALPAVRVGAGRGPGSRPGSGRAASVISAPCRCREAGRAGGRVDRGRGGGGGGGGRGRGGGRRLPGRGGRGGRGGRPPRPARPPRPGIRRPPPR